MVTSVLTVIDLHQMPSFQQHLTTVWKQPNISWQMLQNCMSTLIGSLFLVSCATFC